MILNQNGTVRPADRYVAAMADGIGESSISVELSRHAVQLAFRLPLENARLPVRMQTKKLAGNEPILLAPIDHHGRVVSGATEQVIHPRVASIEKTPWIYKDIFAPQMQLQRQDIVMFMCSDPPRADRTTIEQDIIIRTSHEL
jgi:hypothetical protein